MKRPRADHTAYIHAVAEALRAQEIDADPIDINDANGIRTASLRLHPQDEDHAFTTAEHLDLDWDERRGWALTPHYPPATRLGDVPWHHGPGILPAPKSIAAWAYLLINRPDLTSAHPVIDPDRPTDPSPDLDERLASFNKGN